MKIGQLEAGRERKRGWEGEEGEAGETGHFSATECHTVYGLFMNKLCVSLGHYHGPVTMVSAMRGRRNAALLGDQAEAEGVGGWSGGEGGGCFGGWLHLYLLAPGQSRPWLLSSLAVAVSLQIRDPLKPHKNVCGSVLRLHNATTTTFFFTAFRE